MQQRATPASQEYMQENIPVSSIATWNYNFDGYELYSEYMRFKYELKAEMFFLLIFLCIYMVIWDILCSEIVKVRFILL